MVSRLCYHLQVTNYTEIAENSDFDVEETILKFLTPLLTEVHWLAKDISASHVLRSIICLLYGIPVIAERKVIFVQLIALT